MTPERRQRARRALYEVSEDKSIRQAAEDNDLSYSFLQRRISGEVIPYLQRKRPLHHGYLKCHKEVWV
jgi:hypothetical protein